MTKATKIKSPRISHADTYFRPVLLQVANNILRSKKHSEITDHSKHIKSHYGHNAPDHYLARTLRFKAIYSR